MTRELLLTTDPITPSAVPRPPGQGNVGAIVTFSGVVRGTEAGAPIRALEYEAFQRMAEHQFQLIFRSIEQRWPVESVRVIHRLGMVPVNEPSLWVEITAGHRAEAFAACEFLVDEMKRLVPIWKRPIAVGPDAKPV